MAEQNLDMYLSEQDEKFQKKDEKLKKRKASFKRKSIIFGCIFLGFIVICFIGSSLTRSSVYNELKDAEISDPEAMEKIAGSEDAIVYSDVYDKYEAGCLGNKSLNSLNYGLMTENQYGYTTINDNNETVLHTSDGQEHVIASEQISQINLTQDLVIYRGADKRLYTCKYDGSDKTVIIDGKIGTALLTGDNIYYISYDNANNLYKYNIADESVDLVTDADIKTFTIAADKVLYLTYENKLSAQTIGSFSPSWTVSNVDKFYFNGDVYVQNNEKIIKFNLNKHNPKDIADGVNEFLGADENNVYYTTEQALYSQSLTDGEKQELPYNYDYYKGVYSINGQITALGGLIQ